jgi:hypothetical protein
MDTLNPTSPTDAAIDRVADQAAEVLADAALAIYHLPYTTGDLRGVAREVVTQFACDVLIERVLLTLKQRERAAEAPRPNESITKNSNAFEPQPVEHKCHTCGCDVLPGAWVCDAHVPALLR